MTEKTPRELGYRMPAEWQPHAATWLSWPRPDGISFPNRYEEVLPTLGEMVRAIAPHERVEINVRDEQVESIARRTVGANVENVFYHRIPSYEPWCRDHGPIFVKKIRNPKSEIRNSTADPLAVIDWAYNAYGKKYPLYDDDDAVPQRVADLLKLQVFGPNIVLEGGSIDVNGQGSLLTTTSCLLNSNRNPHLNQQQIEQSLRDYLGVSNVLWLGGGIDGDDTDGHVDNLARFVNRTTVVTVVEQDPLDINYQPLEENLRRLAAMRDQDGRPLRTVSLPMPGVVEYHGKRLPASYANFYIANNVVLLPTYRNPTTDKVALNTLQNLFPDRRVVGIDSTNLIWGLGSFHCLTQQQPAG
jgi:agmatine deiminase